MRRGPVRDRPYNPSDDVREFVEQVNSRLAAARRWRSRYHQGWAESLAFYEGQQWAVWSETLSTMVQGDDPSYRVRLVDNQITSLLQLVAAKRARVQHVTTAAPNNPKAEEDVAAATAATHILRHVERVTGFAQTRLEIELMAALYGTCFIQVAWDASAEAAIGITDPDTGLVVHGGYDRIGEFSIRAFSPWAVYAAPHTRWDDVHWCAVAQLVPRASLRAIYGNAVDYAAAEAGGCAEPDLLREQRVASLHNQVEGTGGAGFDVQEDASNYQEQDDPESMMLMHVQYWEKPCPNYPDGRFAQLIGDVLVSPLGLPLPNPRKRLPIIPVVGMWTPGTYYGIGWVQLLIAQQRRLNRTESRVAEALDLMGNPKWAAPMESAIEEGTLTNEPGEVVFYSVAGGPPTPMAPPQLMTGMIDYPERIAARMKEIAGVHEISSRAGVPSGVTSGYAIKLIQEGDDTRQGLGVKWSGIAIQNMSRLVLEMAQVLYDLPRFVQVLGRGGNVDEALAIQSADISGATDVLLEESDGTQGTIEAKRQRILEYRGAGLFDLPLEMQIMLFELMGETELVESLGELQQQQAELQQQQAELQAQMMPQFEDEELMAGEMPAEGGL